MITFYRIEEQRAIPYNGDAPFVNWIGRFSTGLIRYGRLIFEIDNPKEDSNDSIHIKLPNQEETNDPKKIGHLIEDWTFGIYKPITDSEEHDFGDGPNQWDSLMSQLKPDDTIKPQIVNGHKLYDVIIVCRSNVEGEFIDDLVIGNQVYKIGCEFWGENETIKIELANKGIEFTDLIRKAIYSNDVHEDNPDWLLLNRKYRELAMNFLDIYGNKGSYKSLINSLKWFEYLDLVELREVWKYETPAGTKYFDQPIQQLLSEECERQMFNSAKTTYFALRSLKNYLDGTDDIELPTPPEPPVEPDPEPPVEPDPGPPGEYDPVPLNEQLWICWYPVGSKYMYQEGYEDLPDIYKDEYRIWSENNGWKSIPPTDPSLTHEVSLKDGISKWRFPDYTLSTIDGITYKSPYGRFPDSLFLYIGTHDPEFKDELVRAWHVQDAKDCRIKFCTDSPNGFAELDEKVKSGSQWEIHLNRSLGQPNGQAVWDNKPNIPFWHGWWLTDGWKIGNAAQFGIYPAYRSGKCHIWVEYTKDDGTKLVSNKIEFEGYLNDVITDKIPLTNKSRIQKANASTNTIKLPHFTNTVYDCDPDEIQPEGLACIWSEEEMRLKMALLGAFYEHYFMPIHLNLIRSSIEEYSAHLINMFHSSEDVWIDECASEGQNNFELDWDSDQGDEEDPDDPGTGGSKSKLNLHLDVVHVVSGASQGNPYDTAFQNTIPVRSNEPYIPIVACFINEYDPNYNASGNVDLSADDLFKRITLQHYNGIGATATGHFKFPEGIVGGVCETNVYGETIRTSFSADGSKSEFDITFLFPRQGDFMMSLKFYGASGRTFTKHIDIHVEDNISVDINIRKLVPAFRYGEDLPDPFSTIMPTAMDNEVPVDSNPRLWFARTREQHVIPSEEDPWYDLDSGFDHIQYIPLHRADNSINAPYKTDVYTIIWRGLTNTLKTTQSRLDDFLTKSGIANNTIFRCGIEPETDKPSYAWVQYIAKRRGNVVDVNTSINHALNKFKDKEFKRSVFFPEFHKLEDASTTDVEKIYPIVCQPVININLGNGEIKTVPYSMHMDAGESAWEFFSWQEHKNIADINTSTCDPFIGWNHAKPIPTGYYTVKFKYKFGNDTKEVSRVTPFRII